MNGQQHTETIPIQRHTETIPIQQHTETIPIQQHTETIPLKKHNTKTETNSESVSGYSKMFSDSNKSVGTIVMKPQSATYTRSCT